MTIKIKSKNSEEKIKISSIHICLMTNLNSEQFWCSIIKK